MKHLIVPGLATLLALPVPALAETEELAMLSQAKITLTQAIAAAEKHQGGQAIEASLEDDSFKPAYEVSIVKDGHVFDVEVDGVDGSILGTHEDKDD